MPEKGLYSSACKKEQITLFIKIGTLPTSNTLMSLQVVVLDYPYHSGWRNFSRQWQHEDDC
jgi:hypothetical protein